MKIEYILLWLRRCGRLACSLPAVFIPGVIFAQTIAPEFVGPYSLRSLGAVPDLPESYAAMIFQQGDNQVLLIGGYANGPLGAIYAVKVQRGTDQHITGFSGSVTYFADASGVNGGGIDGGLTYAPNGVLFYTSYCDNVIGEVTSGSSVPSRKILLDDLGYGGSVGAALIVTDGLPGAGRIKITSYKTSRWYDATISPDGSGTYSISAPANGADGLQLDAGGPEAVVYVEAGSPRFPKASVLIGYYSENRVRAYEIDANGDPIVATGRDFITGLNGITGATFDPVTGDFMFSSFSEPVVYAVGGFSVAKTQIAITSPQDGVMFTAPAGFYVEVGATQPGGSIDHVELYRNSASQGSIRQPPYEWFQSDLSAGSYAFTAAAYDGAGLATTSAVANVKIVNATLKVTLLSPTGTSAQPSCSSVVLTAQPSGGAPPLNNVAFYDGGIEVGRLTTAPYRLFLPHLIEGSHVFSARATDADGLVATSGTATINVQPLATNKLLLHNFLPGKLVFCFKGLAGSNYVWETTSILGQNWRPFLTNTAPSGPLVVTNSLPAAGSGFFRTKRM